MKKKYFVYLLVCGALISACSTNDPIEDEFKDLYVPTVNDTTATASLTDLTEGRSLYIQNCNACHQLYSPDRYSASAWKPVIQQMAPKTRLTTTEVELVTKYLCKGKN